MRFRLDLQANAAGIRWPLAYRKERNEITAALLEKGYKLEVRFTEENKAEGEALLAETKAALGDRVLEYSTLALVQYSLF